MSNAQPTNDGRHDFDFLFGEWTVHNRSLRERLAGSDDWVEFEGRLTVRPVLGGLGNVDTVEMNVRTGVVHGMTLRLFNPASREWSLYWADSRTGVLLPPLVGTFRDGVGTFYAQETHAERHVFNRFIWSDITETTCHWEQALSSDGGATWETNWTMDFDRIR